MPSLNRPPAGYRGKRAFDLLLLALALPVVLPVLGAVAILVRWNMGSPVLFSQARAGRDGRIFHLVKFRTMRDGTDAEGRPLPDEERLTPFGRWLRATSLDELPELLNILRGEMSFVGPRPLHARYLARYSERQRRRLEATPGLTGLAQISGRNAIGWAERFELDIDYVQNGSFRLDCAILVRTVAAVLTKRGVDPTEGETMPEFMGSGCGREQ